MKNNLYNTNDKEYKHVIKLLKNLPRENAPDNFEYNLSIKIKNKNFDLNTKEPWIFLPWKFLLPATGAVIASVIVFFTVFGDSSSFENPFHIQPKLRSELNSNILNSLKVLETLENKNIISDNDVVMKNETEAGETTILSEAPVSKNKALAETEVKETNFPFQNYNSTNLDEVLSEKNNSTKISKRATLAGRNNSSFFNGFYIREEVDKEYVEALKARMDSLKREMKISRKKTKSIK